MMSTAGTWVEDRYLARWEKSYPCGVFGRCGSTEDVHRGTRRTRFWVRLVQDKAVLLFSDGFLAPEEAMAWADLKMEEGCRRQA